jgi:hypothetical protein
MVFMSQPRPALSKLRHPAQSGWLDKKAPRRLFLFALAVFTLWIDYRTGPSVLFPIWFAIPVVISAWYEDLRRSLAYAILLPLARVGMKFLWPEAITIPLSLFITNFVIRTSSLSLIAYLAARCGRLTRDIRVLQGLLPICVSCQRLRSPEGHWQRLDAYFSDYSEAILTHSMCQDCLAKTS